MSERFTETNYRKLLQFVKTSGYKFISFTRSGYGDLYNCPHVLWRHDIDMSPHRASRISAIEMEEDVQSTYFVHLHSAFYNLFEESVVNQISNIIDNGHIMGLHFDIDFYKKNLPEINPMDMVEVEMEFIWNTFCRKPMAISFHNPSLSKIEIPDYVRICGMANAHSKFIRENYTYCSDSNSVWNHNRLEDAIRENAPRIHVLTHPEWWTNLPMSKHEKVERCIIGRCENQRRMYNMLMEDVYAKED